ncbi:MAG: hypothetical protein R3C68_19910, partial [Myxococcota bacterium]
MAGKGERLSHIGTRDGYPPETVSSDIGLRLCVSARNSPTMKSKSATQATALGAIEPLPTDRFRRLRPSSDNDLIQHSINRTILDPKAHLCLTDLDDYDLVRYGIIKEIDDAIDCIVSRGAPLCWSSEGFDSGSFPPLTQLLRHALEAANSAAPLPYREWHEPALLRDSGSGLMEAAVRHLWHQAARGACLSRRSMATLFGNAGELLFDAWRAQVPYRRGLHWLLARGALPVTPKGSRLPLTRGEAEQYLGDPSVLASAVRASSIPEAMPLITRAAQMIPADSFAGFYAVCVQHVLGTQVPLFKALASKGLEPDRVEIVGVPYSTNFITQSVMKNLGYHINTPSLSDQWDVEQAMARAVQSALERILKRACMDGQPILVMDDGGKATM